MPELRLAVATRCLRLPLLDSLRAAQSAGVRAVQFDVRDELKPADLSESGLRQFRNRLGEHGLSVASVTFPLRRPLYDPQHLDERVAALRQAMEFGWKLGTRVLSARIGRIPAADTRERTTLREVLDDLARAGNHIGVTLAVSPSDESPQELRELFDSVQAGPIGLDLDPAAFVAAGHSPAAAVRTLHDRLLHAQARDGLRDLAGGGTETELGRGQVNWPELLAVLHEAAYDGWLTVLRTQGTDLAGDVARGLAFLRQYAFA